MLEAYAVRLFIEKIDETTLRTIEDQVKRSLSVGRTVNSETNFEFALEFHDLLVAASGNSHMVQMHNTFKRHQRRYQHFAFARLGHDEHAMEEHAVLLDALRNKDLKAVERDLSAHLWRFYECVAPMFDKD